MALHSLILTFEALVSRPRKGALKESHGKRGQDRMPGGKRDTCMPKRGRGETACGVADCRLREPRAPGAPAGACAPSPPARPPPSSASPSPSAAPRPWPEAPPPGASPVGEASPGREKSHISLCLGPGPPRPPGPLGHRFPPPPGRPPPHLPGPAPEPTLVKTRHHCQCRSFR